LLLIVKTEIDSQQVSDKQCINNTKYSSRNTKLYKNKFVAEQEIGFLPNRNDVKKLENELIKLKSLEKCVLTRIFLRFAIEIIAKSQNMPISFKNAKKLNF